MPVLAFASGPYRKKLPEELRRKDLENYRDDSWPLETFAKDRAYS